MDDQGNNFSIIQTSCGGGACTYVWVSGYPFTYCDTTACAVTPWGTNMGGQPSQIFGEDFLAIFNYNDGQGPKLNDAINANYNYVCEIIST